MNLIMVLTSPLPDSVPVLRLRGVLLKPFFKRCGKNLQIATGVQILNPHRIEIGDDVFIGYHCWINGLGGLVIEDEVMLGPFVVVATLQHNFVAGSVRYGGETAKPVSIGRGSWVAAHACIAGGLRIGKGCLVAAGSVVTKDIPDHVVVGGVPASVLRHREDDGPGPIRNRWDG